MTTLNVRTARAIWLVDARDLNPRGLEILPMLDAIRDRYSFQVYPRTIEEANEQDPKGIVFAGGSFDIDGGRYAIVKATMYGDGIVAESVLSTDFTEAFLADALSFLSGEFGLTYRPEMIHKKIYLSELVVHTEKSLNPLFSKLSGLGESLSRLTGQIFEPTGFSFGIDTQATPARPVPFRLEREVNKGFDQGRYYSAAPLRTSEHEDLLRELEGML
jgi:hypothetical protein